VPTCDFGPRKAILSSKDWLYRSKQSLKPLKKLNSSQAIRKPKKILLTQENQ